MAVGQYLTIIQQPRRSAAGPVKTSGHPPVSLCPACGEPFALLRIYSIAVPITDVSAGSPALALGGPTGSPGQADGGVQGMRGPGELRSHRLADIDAGRRVKNRPAAPNPYGDHKAYETAGAIRVTGGALKLIQAMAIVLGMRGMSPSQLNVLVYALPSRSSNSRGMRGCSMAIALSSISRLRSAT